MKDKFNGSKESSELPLCLEDSYISSDLITTHTSKKEEMIGEIRCNLAHWFKNETVRQLMHKKVDIGLGMFICKQKLDRQDVDNVCKVILDAISKRGKDDEGPYLLDNDNQVIRLLIYKQESTRAEELGSCTDQMTLSIREHDPDKQMILIKRDII